MKKLLLGLLLLSKNIAYSEQERLTIYIATPEEAVEIMIRAQAEVQAKEIAQITNPLELDEKVQAFLDLRKGTLKRCEDLAANSKVCGSFISFFEKIISASLARKLEIQAALNAQVNAAEVAEKIEAAAAPQEVCPMP